MLSLLHALAPFFSLCWWSIPLVLLISCTSDQPVKIGFIAGTTGRVADMGISGRDAVQLIVEQANLEGGIHGRKIQLIIKDDRQDQEKAKKEVQALIREGVEAVIGPMTSAMAMVTTPLLNEANLVGISPTVSTEQLAGRDDYFFRVAATSKEYASRSGTYHAAMGSLRRLVAIYDQRNRPYSEDWLRYFTANFTGEGREIVETVGFDAHAGETFYSLIDRLLRQQPDGVLIIANSMDSALICQQIRKFDADMHIILSDWGATERLLDLGGAAVEGATAIQVFNKNNLNPGYQVFREQYVQRYNQEPGYAGVLACEAALVVIEALRRKKRGQTLKACLLAVSEYHGIQGPIRFDAYGDVQRSNATISKVSNQQFVVLE